MLKLIKLAVLLVVLAFCATRVIDWTEKRKKTHPAQVRQVEKKVEKSISGVKGFFNLENQERDVAQDDSVVIVEETDEKADANSNIKKVQDLVEPQKKKVDFAQIYENLQKADEIYSSCEQ